MAETRIDDELWQEFHTVVNMTSRELADWLQTDSAGEETEALPDQAGSALGRQVLSVLGKRKADLTDEDLDAITTVVDRVRRERGEDLEPTAGEDSWRHQLMSIGHDPLKPPRT